MITPAQTTRLRAKLAELIEDGEYPTQCPGQFASPNGIDRFYESAKAHAERGTGEPLVSMVCHFIGLSETKKLLQTT